MNGLQRMLAEDAKKQPGTAELTRRALANFKKDDAENLIAKVYARHLSQAHLAELAKFSESRAGNRLFKIAFANVLEGKKDQDMAQLFNADELTEIVKFSQTEAFSAATKALPVINRELAEEGRKLGEAAMREYIKQQ